MRQCATRVARSERSRITILNLHTRRLRPLGVLLEPTVGRVFVGEHLEVVDVAGVDINEIMVAACGRCVQTVPDQAKRSEAFLRYATKPTPKKPRIIIAQVDGSGTAASMPVN
jgi:hypothetical protein